MKKREFTKSGHSKKAQIARIIIIYLAIASVIITGFSLFIQIVDHKLEIKTSFLDRIYFSGITYFTIGLGDLLPSQDLSKCLVIIEGILGVIVNGLFIGFLVNSIHNSENKVQFTTSIYLTKNAQGRFEANIGIRNLGNLIVEIKRGIDIFERGQNRNSKIICSAYQIRNYLNNKSMVKLDESEYACIFKQIQNKVKYKDRHVYLRFFLSGYDSKKGNTIVAFEECELDVQFVKDVQLVTKYSPTTHKKQSVNLQVEYLTENQASDMECEFLERSYD